MNTTLTDPAEQLAVMLVENLQRTDLTVGEEAKAYQQLLEFPGWTEAKISKRTGRAKATVHGRVQLAQMGDPAIKVVEERRATPQPTTEPIGTLTTVDRYAMITLRGQNAPKDVSQPMDTFAANGNHHGLMSTSVPAVEECTFRMLEPHEVTWGMAFPRDYVMTGTKREQVKQAGNAVTPPAARDLAMIAAESLGVAA